jgi:hypothetical protein
MTGSPRFDWMGRFGRRGGSEAARAPLIASRDLPSPHMPMQPQLPRSPEPMSDEALQFARDAARRPLPVDMEPDTPVPGASIATGADLRAMLERFERSSRRRQAVEQAAHARARLVEGLAAGKANLPGKDATARQPALRVVREGNPADAAKLERYREEEAARLDRAMDEAVASALVTLRRLSASARN